MVNGVFSGGEEIEKKDMGLWCRKRCNGLGEHKSRVVGYCFTQVVRKFAAKLKDAKHVFVPVWGGTYGGGDQHWTWMYLEKNKQR